MKVKRELRPTRGEKGLTIPQGFLEMAGLEGEVQVLVRERRIELVEAEDPQKARLEAMVERTRFGGRGRGRLRVR